MKAVAPGKLILSGEHAVVYGAPALAMAVDRFAEANISSELTPLISLDFLSLSYQKSHTLKTLRRIKHRLTEDYQAFLRGEYGIREVLKRPFELSQYVLTSMLDKFNLALSDGFKLRTHSDIPMGCGMGSSAAMILSILHVIDQHHQLNLKKEHYLSYGMEAENLQHGYSSGLDLQISLSGGCLRYQNGVSETRLVPDLPMYIVNTGKPKSSTGECVTTVAPHFKETSLKQDFTGVTDGLDGALASGEFSQAVAAISENHRLLTTIGVVPEKVQLFITHLEKSGRAAKICGAGAVRGQQAGIVLILSPDNPESICQRFGYTCSPVKGETHGLRAI